MAKKPVSSKSTPAKRGRPKLQNPKPTTPVAITLRADKAWVDWLDRFCDQLSRDSGFPKPERTAMIDFALRQLAESRGFAAPPSRF